MRGKQFWVDALGRGWAMELRNILKDPYANKLMDFIDTQYALNSVIPRRNFLFNAFKLCPWESIRVVILGNEPRGQSRPNGLAFADRDFSIFSNSSVNAIHKCIEREYREGGFYLDFDPALKHWAEQGVLLLNRSLTAIYNKPGTHRKPWGKFTSEVLNVINNGRPGTIFILWGKEAQLLKPHIKDHNYVLECDSPNDYIVNPADWNCPNFKEADEILMKLNGDTIKW